MTEAPVKPLLDPEFLNKLEQLELVSRKIFVGRTKGERKSKRRGSSVEFADHRNYSVGDDLRHIDWNVYGRLDKLFLKLFLEEEDLHVYTLLDTSLSMEFGDPTKLHYGKQIAAALAAHPAPVTVYVPHYAMSGGTLVSLAADRIVMSPSAVLGPVDPQIGEMPAASIATCS